MFIYWFKPLKGRPKWAYIVFFDAVINHWDTFIQIFCRIEFSFTKCAWLVTFEQSWSLKSVNIRQPVLTSISWLETLNSWCCEETHYFIEKKWMMLFKALLDIVHVSFTTAKTLFMKSFKIVVRWLDIHTNSMAWTAYFLHKIPCDNFFNIRQKLPQEISPRDSHTHCLSGYNS